MDTEGHSGTQCDRETNRLRQAEVGGREIQRYGDKITRRQRDREIRRQTDMATKRHRDRETRRQRDTETE